MATKTVLASWQPLALNPEIAGSNLPPTDQMVAGKTIIGNYTLFWIEHYYKLDD
jgi:hypothetical protein